MIKPDFATFKKLAKKGNCIALTKQVPADLETPVSSFLKLAHSLPNAFLLESAEHAEQMGRYSIIGLKPSQILISKGADVFELHGKSKKKLKNVSHITEALQAALKNQSLANSKSIPGFAGGFVGYFGYENVSFFETVKLHPKKGPGSPDSVFFLTQDFLVFDHYKKNLTFVAIARVDSTRSLKKAYEVALQKIHGQITKLKKPLKRIKGQKIDFKNMKSNMSKGEYEEKVNQIKNYIRSGDCIQVVLSQRFTLDAPRNDFQIYRALRSINPSPYMFYFKCGKTRLIGASPELLVKNTGKLAEVRPIAGTRPRGETEKRDRQYEETLKKSPKENAEHLMLVDLGRNDLGRVCEFNSVTVDDYARVERYSHVMHLVSDVSGKLSKKKNRFDLLKATFPAGTVSGAPKIRAMEIIDELETEKRGAYAGSVGFFDYNQNMEMCITIRTLVVEGKKMYLQAGAGIVKDSNPKREYEETVNKAKAVITALKSVEAF